MTKPWRPRLFGNQPYMEDPLHIALYYAHKDIEAKKQTAMEWLRSGSTIPTLDADEDALHGNDEDRQRNEASRRNSPEKSSPPSEASRIESVPASAQRLADEAARRVARASWAHTRMLLKAMGVKP